MGVQCDKKLKGKISFIKHVLEKHLNDNLKNSENEEKINLCCSEYSGLSCDFTSTTSELETFKSHFETHFKPKVRPDTDPYGGFKVFCDLCQNFPMRYVYGLIHHLRSKHPKHTEFICSQHCGYEGKFCDENFSSIDELIAHVKSHLKTHQK